ncbi:hypothetical protein CMQ_1203 [Grosmannia clavigera kw1407]|uniref:Hemerythrin-like domain-containing protein n=1 Tax=Grosmannia clavigera (strain kw1407 / UAMH 11150) TaxID=655863 RepID=F0XD25_GROCL|nr:uncharacterized protein CMQ_1203 [Grosmannia clavigera kw1407]EFX04275.1 hypothetical protein CMQ_1203 [Grosmannia clavigera kw1407]
MATETGSVAAQPWADGPLQLVPTPQYATKKTDLFTTGATHMCLLHNAILRGYNSIFLQAAHIKEEDKADFIGYCLTWFRFVKSHHDDEEEVLFPKVADVLGDSSVWTQTHEEHESFLAGLGAFHDYLAGLPFPADFSGEKLLAIMATFEVPFENHFRSEIGTIAALADHPKAPVPGSPEADAAFAMFKAWGKATVSKAGTLDVVPFFLLNLDRSTGFENGTWANWPPMPAPIRWGLINIAGSWYGKWWRFASCDAAGQPQVLWALRGEPAAPAAKEDL